MDEEHLLVQLRLDLTLEGKPEDMIEQQWSSLEKVFSMPGTFFSSTSSLLFGQPNKQEKGCPRLLNQKESWQYIKGKGARLFGTKGS